MFFYVVLLLNNNLSSTVLYSRYMYISALSMQKAERVSALL